MKLSPPLRKKKKKTWIFVICWPITLSLWIRKVVECFKWRLIDHISRNMEDSGADGDMNLEGQTQEVAEMNIGVWPRD